MAAPAAANGASPPPPPPPDAGESESESARFVALWPPLGVAQAHAFEWAIVAVACAMAAACLAGAACAVPWGRVAAALRSCCCCWPRSKGGKSAAAEQQQQQQQPPPQRQQFNVLWGARMAMQLLGALYVLSLTVPLQIWWAPASPMRYGGRGGGRVAAEAAEATASASNPARPPRPTFPIPSVDTICRVSLGVSYGVLEPAFYLVILFSCVYTVGWGVFLGGGSFLFRASPAPSPFSSFAHTKASPLSTSKKNTPNTHSSSARATTTTTTTTATTTLPRGTT